MPTQATVDETPAAAVGDRVRPMRCSSRLPACPICAGALSPMAEKYTFRYERCSGCGFILVNPRPDAGELLTWYRGHDSFRGASSLDDLLAWERRGRRRKPPGDYDLLRFLAQNLPRGARVLDIGCGHGLMLKQFLDLGFEGHGIELDSVVAADCRAYTGIQPLQCPFEEYDPGGRLFQLVYLNQVIEHVLDLDDWVRRLRSLLAPDGYLVLGTPNARGFYSRIGGLRRDPFYHAPLHLNHFTPQTLSLLLQKHGLQTVRVDVFTNLTPSSFYKHTRGPEALRVFTARALWQLHRPVARTFDLLGWGLLMNVFARRHDTPAAQRPR